MTHRHRWEISVGEWTKDGENIVYRRQYEYDRVGNRTKLTKTDGENNTVYVPPLAPP